MILLKTRSVGAVIKFTNGAIRCVPGYMVKKYGFDLDKVPETRMEYAMDFNPDDLNKIFRHKGIFPVSVYRSWGGFEVEFNDGSKAGVMRDRVPLFAIKWADDAEAAEAAEEEEDEET